jgi:hypothetical protein
MKTSIMNSVLAIATSSLLISSSILITSGSSVVAKQPKHKVGFIKSKVNYLVGDCGYWISGSKPMKNIVFYTGDSGILVNIDGRDLNLTYVKNQKAYKSGMFTVKTNFVDATTAKDRKDFAVRERGPIYFSANDGWKTKLIAECAYDGGG